MNYLNIWPTDKQLRKKETLFEILFDMKSYLIHNSTKCICVDVFEGDKSS